MYSRPNYSKNIESLFIIIVKCITQLKTDQLKMFDLHDDLEGVRMTDEREYKQVLLLSLHIIYSIKPL